MMKEEKQRLVRLRRLEKIRAIAKQTAAAEAAQAEGTLSQLRALSERTRRMASEYASRREVGDGAALRQLGKFVNGLQAISRTTDGDAARAQAIADAKQRILEEAARRRAARAARAAPPARPRAQGGPQPGLGARKATPES